jgi:hypothetical protein
VAEPTRRSGLGRGLESLIPAPGPRDIAGPGPLPPYEDPVVTRIDELIDEVRRLGERVDELVRTTADSARRRLWPRPAWNHQALTGQILKGRCTAGLAHLATTSRDSAVQLVGIGTGLALDLADLALGTTRELLDVARTTLFGRERG